MQRTCVGWPARSVRSLRYHGTVFVWLTQRRTSLRTAPWSLAPVRDLLLCAKHLFVACHGGDCPSRGSKGQLGLGEGFKISEMPRGDAIFCGSRPSLTHRFARDISQVPRRKPLWSIVNLVPSTPDELIEASDVPDSIRRQAYRHLGKARS